MAWTILAIIGIFVLLVVWLAWWASFVMSSITDKHTPDGKSSGSTDEDSKAHSDHS